MGGRGGGGRGGGKLKGSAAGTASPGLKRGHGDRGRRWRRGAADPAFIRVYVQKKARKSEKEGKKNKRGGGGGAGGGKRMDGSPFPVSLCRRVPVPPPAAAMYIVWYLQCRGLYRGGSAAVGH